MSLRVDTSRAPRTYRELQDLLRAVERAGAEDEGEWIEWKSSLDLSAKGTRATLARHIVGMANRRVEEAGRFVEGFGYVLVGIEPGNRSGVSPVDPADLRAGIASYLGPHGPRWTASYSAEDTPPVLIIAVDPPRDGDPIYTLHRDYERYRAGDIFVRKLGSTEKADPADIDYLARREARRARFPRRRVLAAAGVAVAAGLSAAGWELVQTGSSSKTPGPGRAGPARPGGGNKIWSSPLVGVATSAPVVFGGSVFVSTLYEGKSGHLCALRSGDGSQRWSLEAKGSGGFSAPVTVSGMVCVGAGNGVAYALHAGDGTRAWEYAIAAGVDIVPVAGRGVVFVSDGRELIALRVADGRRLWSFPAEAPVLAADVVYTGGRDGRVYALRAGDARRLWRSEPFGTVAIQVVANGMIYVSSDNNANGGYKRMHALRASDGRLLWSFSAGGDEVTGIALDTETVLVGTCAFSNGGSATAAHSCLYALEVSDGSQRWRFPAKGQIYGIVASGGSGYAATADGHVYGISVRDGSRIWSFAPGGEWPTAPVETDSTVFVGAGITSTSYDSGVSVSTPGGHVYELHAGSGKEIWSFRTASTTGQPVVAGGVVYVWSYDGDLYAIRA